MTPLANCLSQLLNACHTIKQLYDVALYGQRHSEVKHLKILEKVGLRQVSALARKDLIDAITEVSAIQEAANSPLVSIDFSSREVGVLKMALRYSLREIRAIPLLARFQAVITLSAAFEGYVADLIRQVFDVNPLALKSGKSTLTDDDLVDAICQGDTLSLLKDHRLRNIMYGSVGDWFDFLRKNFGMTIEHDDTLMEMFLVRNALAHNLNYAQIRRSQRRWSCGGRGSRVQSVI